MNELDEIRDRVVREIGAHAHVEQVGSDVLRLTRTGSARAALVDLARRAYSVDGAARLRWCGGVADYSGDEWAECLAVDAWHALEAA